MTGWSKRKVALATALGAALALAGCMEIEVSKPKPRLEASGTAGSDFGATLLRTRKQLDFEFSNSGAGFAKVETLTNISITVAGVGLTLSHNCPTQLAETESCFVSVGYAPTVTGALAGQLRIASNAEDSPLVRALSATAVDALDPAAGALVFSVNPGGAFGTVARGRSKSNLYTLHNIGNADDEITIAGPTETDWSFSHDCPAVLLVDATCLITVTFAPTSTGVQIPSPLLVTDAYNRDYRALAVSLSASGE